MPNPRDPKKFPETYTITITRVRLLRLGLIHCKHCRYPPNNHFDFPPYSCAHDSSCPGYEEEVVI